MGTFKGVWVSAILSDRNSFKTLLGYGLLPKDKDWKYSLILEVCNENCFHWKSRGTGKIKLPRPQETYNFHNLGKETLIIVDY